MKNPKAKKHFQDSTTNEKNKNPNETVKWQN